MKFYENELKALKKSSRYRQREIFPNSYIDMASNDYLGFSQNQEIKDKTIKDYSKLEVFSPKASMLVNGYHSVHKDFEDELCRVNSFEAGVVLGSGFNANIAMIEALARRGDHLIVDQMYHASGILATKLVEADLSFFKHNSMLELEEILKNSKAKRKIVCVEGIYSMDADITPYEVFELCDRYGAILIVDEAHSSGVIGEKLLGLFDFYGVKPKANHIKMGTLGKAYGSFGAYILASEHIIDFLLNRAKPIVYATSLSLFDTLYAHNSLKYILKHKEYLKSELKRKRDIVYKELGVVCEANIVKIDIGSNSKVMDIKQEAKDNGYLIGAIRQPTVSSAIIRIILRIGIDDNDLKELIKIVKRHI